MPFLLGFPADFMVLFTNPFYKFLNSIDSIDNDNIYFAVKLIDQNNNIENKWIPINKLIEKMDTLELQRILTGHVSGGEIFEEWINK